MHQYEDIPMLNVFKLEIPIAIPIYSNLSFPITKNKMSLQLSIPSHHSYPFVQATINFKLSEKTNGPH